MLTLLFSTVYMATGKQKTVAIVGRGTNGCLLITLTHCRYCQTGGGGERLQSLDGRMLVTLTRYSIAAVS